MLLSVIRPEAVAAPPQADTVAAVVLGAFLATVSGFAATQLETFFARRRRERDAALLFGEILSPLGVILEGAEAARGRGDPYGSFTMRLLRAARRELDIYDRNRESLCEFRDGVLRRSLQSLFVRLAMTLDGLLDERAADNEARDQAFGFLMGTAREIAPLIATLARLYGREFADYSGEGRRAAAAGSAPAAD